MENSGMSNNDKADKIRKMRSLSAFFVFVQHEHILMGASSLNCPDSGKVAAKGKGVGTRPRLVFGGADFQ